MVHHRLTNRIPVHIHVEKFINQLIERKITFKQEKNWHQWLQNLKEKYNQKEEIAHFVQNQSPYTFINGLNEILKEEDIITTDVGQNQMWAAQTIKIKPKQTKNQKTHVGRVRGRGSLCALLLGM